MSTVRTFLKNRSSVTVQDFIKYIKKEPDYYSEDIDTITVIFKNSVEYNTECLMGEAAEYFGLEEI